MPRSLAERAVDRASLSARSRTSVGRFSVGTEVSVSSAATRHWVNSVSDIYGPDEIEELLADLNRLEFSRLEGGHLDPVACAASPHLDNFDNFDIDGSRAEGLDLVSECGPASPLVPRPRSPGSVSTRSWNSHTHYHQFKAPPADYDWGGSRGPGHLVRPLQAAVCYCDMSVLKSPRTLLRVLVLVTSLACLSSLVTSGSARLGVLAWPHIARLRLLLFISFASALFSLLVICLDISHLHALLPMDYSKMQTIVYLLLTAGYLASSSVAAWALLSLAAPAASRQHLITTTVLGYICSVQTLVCSYEARACGRAAKLEASWTSCTLQETVTTRAVTADSIFSPPAAPARPAAPPAPRPLPRSQHNHAGAGRQLAWARAVVRSVSQHALQPPLDYELRPRVPDLTEDPPSPAPSPAPGPLAPLAKPDPSSHEPTLAANYRNSSHLPSPPLQQLQGAGAHTAQPQPRLGNNAANDFFGKDSEKCHNSTVSPLSPDPGQKAEKSRTSSNSRVGAERTNIPGKMSDIHKIRDSGEAQEHLLDYNHTEIHPDVNSFYVPVKNMRETGAIPKKSRQPPQPPVHPDEIISVPLDTDLNLSPTLSASNQKQRCNNYAH